VPSGVQVCRIPPTHCTSSPGRQPQVPAGRAVEPGLGKQTRVPQEGPSFTKDNKSSAHLMGWLPRQSRCPAVQTPGEQLQFWPSRPALQAVNVAWQAANVVQGRRSRNSFVAPPLTHTSNPVASQVALPSAQLRQRSGPFSTTWQPLGQATREGVRPSAEQLTSSLPSQVGAVFCVQASHTFWLGGALFGSQTSPPEHVSTVANRLRPSEQTCSSVLAP